MPYVDGFVLPIPKRHVQTYRRIAQRAGKLWREHGALEYRECVGDDLKTKMGIAFPRLARVKTGETVVVSGQLQLAPGTKVAPREIEQGSTQSSAKTIN